MKAMSLLQEAERNYLHGYEVDKEEGASSAPPENENSLPALYPFSVHLAITLS